MTGALTIFGVGDLAPRRADPASILTKAAPVLREGDLVFGQLETTLSDQGSPLPQARLAMRSDPSAARAIADAGVQVVSFAGNHCMDWSREAFDDTLVHARGAGLALCGAGADIAEARRPALIDRNGLRIAFLAYSSVLPQAYEAQTRRPGCAPLRAFTSYEAIEHDQPGTPPRVHTFCHRGDLQCLTEDIGAARRQADLVVVSVHWGIHFVPAEIAEYQREAAHAAIEAGAEAVLGHHPHILKGVEFHSGRPIFYSLGNFAIEQPQAFAENLFSTRGFAEISALNAGFDVRRAYIAPPDTQKSMIAKLTVRDGRVVRVAFQPVMIDDDAVPHPLGAADPRFEEVARYVEAMGASQGMTTAYGREGNDVIVSASA